MDDEPARNRTDLAGTAARMTGEVLALSSMLIAAPVLLVFQALTMKSDRKIRSSTRAKADDLKSREYRDELGEIHHHTRTFMRDHAGELQIAA